MCTSWKKENIDVVHYSFSTIKQTIVSVRRRDGHHCSNHPADVNGIASALNLLCRVFQRIPRVVQDLKTDVHYIVLKLGEGAKEGGGDRERER